jgi:hypothetical protein
LFGLEVGLDRVVVFSSLVRRHDCGVTHDACVVGEVGVNVAPYATLVIARRSAA